MKQYCLLLLTVTAVKAWSFGQSESKEDLSTEPRNYRQSHFWIAERRPYLRISRSAYRGRELFGKRSGKTVNLPDQKLQHATELLEQIRESGEQMFNDNDSELNRLVSEPEFWSQLNNYYNFLYRPESFQRERRRRFKQRELFG